MNKVLKYSIFIALLCVISVFISTEGNYASGKKVLKKAITTVEEYDSVDLPIISAIPERNIYLYGIKDNKGVVLYVNGIGHYFDWIYLTPRFILPEMNVGDFDKDGKEELSIILYVASGTGIAVEELHIIELSEREFLSTDPSSKNYYKPNPEYFKDHCYVDYLSQLKKIVSMKTYKKNGKLMAKVIVDKKPYVVELKDVQATDKNIKVKDDVCFGDIVYFYSKNNKLSAKFAFGIMSDKFVTPFFIGNVNVDIQYSKGSFKMTNASFTLEE